MPDLLTPVQIGAFTLPNRVVMAPMTRNRAQPDGQASALMAQYYEQRGRAGMVVVEGTTPSPDGYAYIRMPGLWSEQHAESFRPVVQGIHRKGGIAVLQLMHGGRVASSFNRGVVGGRTLAPSAVALEGDIWTDAAGMKPHDVPAEMSLSDIAESLEAYSRAARWARAVGFDGVELHGTSGYLPSQFLSENVNRRTDTYGGSLENRARYFVELMQVLVEAVGAERVGLRLCPGNPYNGIQDSDPAASSSLLMREAQHRGLAYLHIMRSPLPDLDAIGLAQSCFTGALIVNDSYQPDTARQVVASGVASAVSFGRHFIGNPDLVERIRSGTPLAKFDRKTLYTAGPEGYTDY